MTARDSQRDDIIICRDIHKWYGSHHAVRGITTTVGRGETVVLIGPSGSGKSTFLHTINHLENHQRGDIIVDGTLVNADTRNVESVRRNIGMVFQGPNLFPHMSVMDNLTLAPLKVRKLRPEDARQEALELLERVGLTGQADQMPHRLSGGQQQRAAIARARAMQPRIMLLDEPTSALNVEMVREVLDVMRDLAASAVTLLAATHELRFAQEAADRVIMLDEGQIVEDRPPGEFFSSPKHHRARRFLAGNTGLASKFGHNPPGTRPEREATMKRRTESHDS